MTEHTQRTLMLRSALAEIRSLAYGDLNASVSAIMAIRHVLDTISALPTERSPAEKTGEGA